MIIRIASRPMKGRRVAALACLTALSVALSADAKTIKAIDEVNEAVVPSERGPKVVAEDDKWDWIDGRDIPMEGRAFEDGLTHWCRLPADAKGKVVSGI